MSDLKTLTGVAAWGGDGVEESQGDHRARDAHARDRGPGDDQREGEGMRSPHRNLQDTPIFNKGYNSSALVPVRRWRCSTKWRT